MRPLIKTIRVKSLLIFLLFSALSTSAQQLAKTPFAKKEWSVDYKPFRIAGNLYYVGTYDLACYLISTPKGLILINTGLPGSAPMIRAHVEALGFRFSDIRVLLATHAHYDHVGDMAAIKKATGAKLMINELDAPVMANGGVSDYALGHYGVTFMPVKADKQLNEHDTVKFGGIQIIPLHHPGHTKGACSFLFTVADKQRSYIVLIANMPSVVVDTLRSSGVPGYPDIAKDYNYTFEAMKNIHFDIWLASHASQFDLQKKHPQGSKYKPEAFIDQQGYDSALNDLQKAFVKKLDSQ